MTVACGDGREPAKQMAPATDPQRTSGTTLRPLLISFLNLSGPCVKPSSDASRTKNASNSAVPHYPFDHSIQLTLLPTLQMVSLAGASSSIATGGSVEIPRGYVDGGRRFAPASTTASVPGIRSEGE